jgi:FkbM family methyltransferase
MRHAKTFVDFYKMLPVLNRVFDSKSLITWRGQIFHIDSVFGDQPGIIASLLRDPYGLRYTRLPPNSVIYDLGAHIDSFAVMARDCFPDATIVCVEPSPPNLRLLRKNEPFAEILPFATVRDGSIFIDEAVASSTREESSKGAEVKAVSLDTLLKRENHVDLLKIDIEASERELLQNAFQETLRKIDKIVMEVHTWKHADNKQWIIQWAQKQTYCYEWRDSEILFMAMIMREYSFYGMTKPT